MPGPFARRTLGWLAVGVLLLGTVGCFSYEGHTNMGNTEKWVASDVPWVARALWVPPVSIWDAVWSPFTASIDYIFRDPQYHPDHEFLSYAGSRTIGRSDLADGWKIYVSLFPIVIETVWLPLTGFVDLVTVVGFGDEGAPE